MKRFIFALIVSFILVSNAYARFLPNYHQDDKKLHTAGSYILASSVFPLINKKVLKIQCKSKLTCGLLVFGESVAAGVVKEIRDEHTPNDKFDHLDLRADIIGALLGSFAYVELKF